MSQSIAVAFSGSGAVKRTAAVALLNDWLGFGEADADGFYAPSDTDVRVYFPSSPTHDNPELGKVVNWSMDTDVEYIAVAPRGHEALPGEVDTIESATETVEAVNVNKTLIELLRDDDAEEKALVLLWGEEGDEDSEALLTLADIHGIKVKDLTEGLDDISFADDDVEDEPEPEKPARASRRAHTDEPPPAPKPETPVEAPLTEADIEPEPVAKAPRQTLPELGEMSLGVGADGSPVGAYPPGEPRTMSAEEVEQMPVKRPGPITLQDRQGVFVHSFKCSICDVEFVVFSWRADRHRVGSTFCPECGTRTPMIHWRAQTSDSLEFRSDGYGLEIHQMCPPIDSPVMVDTRMPPDDRYTFPNDQPEPTCNGVAAPEATGGRAE